MNSVPTGLAAPTRSKSPAFTLIELLIVIGILGLLAAMLLPALAKVRQKAYAAQCLSNLKQAGAGLQMYVDDNRDRLPGPVWAGAMASYDITSSQELIWHIASYLWLSGAVRHHRGRPGLCLPGLLA